MFLTLLLLTAMAIFIVILIDDRWMGARGFAVFSGNGDGRIVDHAARQSALFFAFLGGLLLSYYSLHWIQYGV